MHEEGEKEKKTAIFVEKLFVCGVMPENWGGFLQIKKGSGFPKQKFLLMISPDTIFFGHGSKKAEKG
jgi:hypothetical protein